MINGFMKINENNKNYIIEGEGKSITAFALLSWVKQ